MINDDETFNDPNNPIHLHPLINQSIYLHKPYLLLLRPENSDSNINDINIELLSLGPNKRFNAIHILPFLNIIDLTFLNGYQLPTLLFLYKQRHTHAGRISVADNCNAIVSYTLDLAENNIAKLISNHELPYSSYKLYALPSPNNGAFIFSSSVLLHFNHERIDYAISVNSLGQRDYSDVYSKVHDANTAIRLDLACMILLKQSTTANNKLLCTLHDGSVYLIEYKVTGQNIQSLSFHNIAQVSRPSSISLIDANYIFFASHTSHSILATYDILTNQNKIKVDDQDISQQMNTSSSETNLDEDSLDQLLKDNNNNNITLFTDTKAEEEAYGTALQSSNTNLLSTKIQFQLCDILFNPGPINDFEYGLAPDFTINTSLGSPEHFYRSSIMELIHVSGQGKEGGITISTQGIIPSISNIFSLNNNTFNKCWSISINNKSYILVTNNTNTIILQIYQSKIRAIKSKLMKTLEFYTGYTLDIYNLKSIIIQININTIYFIHSYNGKIIDKIDLKYKIKSTAISKSNNTIIANIDGNNMYIISYNIIESLDYKIPATITINAIKEFQLKTNIKQHDDTMVYNIIDINNNHLLFKNQQQQANNNATDTTSIINNHENLDELDNLLLLQEEEEVKEQKVQHNEEINKIPDNNKRQDNGENNSILYISRKGGSIIELYDIKTMKLLWQCKDLAVGYDLLINTIKKDNINHTTSTKATTNSTSTTTTTTTDLNSDDLINNTQSTANIIRPPLVIDICICQIGDEYSPYFLLAYLDNHDILIYKSFYYMNNLRFKRLKSNSYKIKANIKDDNTLYHIKSYIKPLYDINGYKHIVLIHGIKPAMIIADRYDPIIHSFISNQTVYSQINNINATNNTNGIYYSSKLLANENNSLIYINFNGQVSIANIPQKLTLNIKHTLDRHHNEYILQYIKKQQQQDQQLNNHPLSLYNYIYMDNNLIMRYIPITSTIHKIIQHKPTMTYAVLISRKFKTISLEDDSDTSLINYQIKFELLLYNPRNWKVIGRYDNFKQGEQVLCLESIIINNKTWICLGCGSPKTEANIVRGREVFY